LQSNAIDGDLLGKKRFRACFFNQPALFLPTSPPSKPRMTRRNLNCRKLGNEHAETELRPASLAKGSRRTHSAKNRPAVEVVASPALGVPCCVAEQPRARPLSLGAKIFTPPRTVPSPAKS